MKKNTKRKQKRIPQIVLATVGQRWKLDNSTHVMLYYDRQPGRVIVRLPAPQPIDPPEIRQVLTALNHATKGRPKIGRWREELQIGDVSISMSVTLSVEDSILKEVRRIAVEQGTTANGLVRRFLHERVDQKKTRAKARRNLLKMKAKV